MVDTLSLFSIDCQTMYCVTCYLTPETSFRCFIIWYFGTFCAFVPKEILLIGFGGTIPSHEEKYKSDSSTARNKLEICQQQCSDNHCQQFPGQKLDTETASINEYSKSSIDIPFLCTITIQLSFLSEGLSMTMNCSNKDSDSLQLTLMSLYIIKLSTRHCQ